MHITNWFVLVPEHFLGPRRAPISPHLEFRFCFDKGKHVSDPNGHSFCLLCRGKVPRGSLWRRGWCFPQIQKDSGCRVHELGFKGSRLLGVQVWFRGFKVVEMSGFRVQVFRIWGFSIWVIRGVLGKSSNGTKKGENKT